VQVSDVIDGKYELVRILGEGGMGAVWEGRHTRIGRRCALKFLHAELNQNSDIVARFIREAQAAAAIGSEHIVDVTDVGEIADGSPYLVMEYLEGSDFAGVLKAEGRLEPTRAARLVIQAARAVAAAHEQGIIHRDLKPENLYLTRREDGSEWVKVLDFGIAKFRDSLAKHAPNLTATGTVLGTPYYMAPEQARGAKDLSEQADIYSMGVILYELLCGEPPFTASSYNELIVLIATTDPRPARMLRPDLSEGLEHVIMAAMARDRQNRYRSMRQLIDALTPFTEDARAPLPQTAIVTPAAGMPGATYPTPPGPFVGLAAGTPPGGASAMAYGTPPGVVAQTPPGSTPVGPMPTPTGPQVTPASWPGTSTMDDVPAPRSRVGLVIGVVVGLLVLIGGGVAAAVVLTSTSGDGGPADPVHLGNVVPTPPPPLPPIPPTPPATPTGDATPAGAAADGGAAATAPATKTIELTITTDPAEATIRVDGIEVEDNPFTATFPRDGARHRIEASAEGHRDSGQFVVYDQDRAVELSLRPAPRRPTKTDTTSPTRPERPIKRGGREIDRSNPFGGG